MKALIVHLGAPPNVNDHQVDLKSLTELSKGIQIAGYSLVMVYNIADPKEVKRVEQLASASSIPFVGFNSDLSLSTNCLSKVFEVEGFIEGYLEAVKKVSLKSDPRLFFSEVAEVVLKNGAFI